MLNRTLSAVRRPLSAPLSQPARAFSGYEGAVVFEEDLVKKHADWAIEETSFSFGRRLTTPVFKAEDDMARRTLVLQAHQSSHLHTRLRDGTVIPVMWLSVDEVIGRPFPMHSFTEPPVCKATWNVTYEEAFEPADVPSIEEQEKSLAKAVDKAH